MPINTPSSPSCIPLNLIKSYLVSMKIPINIPWNRIDFPMQPYQSFWNPTKSPWILNSHCLKHGLPMVLPILFSFYRIFEAGETDLQAAFRVASERRDVGRAAFGDGTKFVAAQEAVDARHGHGPRAPKRRRPGSEKTRSFFSRKKSWMSEKAWNIHGISFHGWYIYIYLFNPLSLLLTHTPSPNGKRGDFFYH